MKPYYVVESVKSGLFFEEMFILQAAFKNQTAQYNVCHTSEREISSHSVL